MPRTFKPAPVVTPTLQQDKVITAAAKGDPEAQPLTPNQLKAMVALRMLAVSVKSTTD